jgi:hypothetical protein
MISYRIIVEGNDVLENKRSYRKNSVLSDINIHSQIDIHHDANSGKILQNNEPQFDPVTYKPTPITKETM